jgi:hypothetical protein
MINSGSSGNVSKVTITIHINSWMHPQRSTLVYSVHDGYRKSKDCGVEWSVTSWIRPSLLLVMSAMQVKDLDELVKVVEGRFPLVIYDDGRIVTDHEGDIDSPVESHLIMILAM